jgi:cytochrome P450
VTTGQCLNKSPQVVQYLGKLLGHGNMVGLDGPAWKRLRAMFNPGFANGHLMTLLPYMVDMTVIFCEKLREAAKSGEVIEMEEYAAKLTIDIMGKIVLYVQVLLAQAIVGTNAMTSDADFNAQNAPNPVVETFR